MVVSLPSSIVTFLSSKNSYLHLFGFKAFIGWDGLSRSSDSLILGEDLAHYLRKHQDPFILGDFLLGQGRPRWHGDSVSAHGKGEDRVWLIGLTVTELTVTELT